MRVRPYSSVEKEHEVSTLCVAGSNPARDSSITGVFMETMKCRDLRKGMRVLLTKPASHYEIGSANPLVGTKWECEGTVMDAAGGSAHVIWDSGYSNGYKDNELSATHGGRCKSIWDD